jgi:fructose-bisphosphate aldolase class II
MPVATPDEYGAMLDRALAGRFAFPAVNVTSSQTLNGVLRGLVDAGSDGIVQITVGGARYLGGGDALAGARTLAAMARELAAPLDVLVGVHTDHAPPDSLDGFLQPLIADSAARRGRGEPPLFNSHMFDGSTLPLDENLRRSSELLDLAAAAHVVLEVEVGVVGTCSVPASEGAICSRRRSATSTACMRRARSSCAQRS